MKNTNILTVIQGNIKLSSAVGLLSAGCNIVFIKSIAINMISNHLSMLNINSIENINIPDLEIVWKYSSGKSYSNLAIWSNICCSFPKKGAIPLNRI